MAAMPKQNANKIAALVKSPEIAVIIIAEVALNRRGTIF
jgi:hypothetical protein